MDGSRRVRETRPKARRRLAQRVGVVVALTLLPLTACGGDHSKPSANLAMASCTVPGTSARCGTLTVPENRLTGYGRTIGINVVVVPASGANPAPDPIVWFAGGPGDPAVAAIQSTLNSLVDARVHRDLVFIDQRGTGDDAWVEASAAIAEAVHAAATGRL